MIRALKLKKSRWAICAILGAGALVTQPVQNFHAENNGDTATPIKHVVVIFQENVSFDHYLAAYPVAANPPGEPPFASMITPGVNGLTPGLLSNNPNSTAPF